MNNIKTDVRNTMRIDLLQGQMFIHQAEVEVEEVVYEEVVAAWKSRRKRSRL